MNGIRFPLNSGMRDPAVGDLQAALNLLLDDPRYFAGNDVARAEMRKALERERAAITYDSATAKLVAAFQRLSDLPANGTVDEKTATAFNAYLRKHGQLDESGVPSEGGGVVPSVPGVPSVDGSRLVTGLAITEAGMAAAGVKLRLYILSLGTKDVLFGETTADAQGQYVFGGVSGAGILQIELRVADAAGTEMPLIQPKLIGAVVEPINVVIPAKFALPIEAEFARLAKDLQTAGTDLNGLGKAVESDQRRDLGLLRATTGWDARVLAIGSQAVQISERVQLPAAVVYALVRTGTTPEEGSILNLSAESVKSRLIDARDQGLVVLSDDEIRTAVDVHQKQATRFRLSTVQAGIVSSGAALLASAPVSDADRKIFESVLNAGWKGGDELWSATIAAGVSKEGVATLKLQGKLALLTADNAMLTAQAMKALGATADAADLATKGYYKPETWQALIDQSAATSGQTVDALIPSTISAATTPERKSAYAARMAAEVRRSFPTRVMAAKVANAELKLAAATDDTKAVSGALLAADQKGFVLGHTPVASFYREHPDALPAGAVEADKPKLIAAVKRLHRLYQLTPDDTAMETLAAEGFDSAGAIATMPRERFAAYLTRNFAPKDIGSDEHKRMLWVAEQVHGKALQVDAAGRFMVMAVRQAQSKTDLGFVDPGATALETAKKALIAAAPSFESLFGDQSFCACESCQSVLSPAAYLVDLLRYIDPVAKDWDAFLATWTAEHPGPYPHVDTANKPLKPYDVLIRRRPDLPQLALTCDNTQMALPYVDVVNEILEHYIAANLTPSPFAGDSAGLDSANLIAEPQTLMPDVYTTLRGIKYPLAMPFDLWTTTMRAYCKQLATPFWQVLEAFSPSAGLFDAETDPLPYNVASVLGERLGLSRVDRDLIGTAGSTTTWFSLYGFGDAPTASAGLGDAKRLSARLGISVAELVSLVSTQFVNPALGKLRALHRLGVNVETVCRYKSAAGYLPMDPTEQAAFQAKLAQLGTDTGENVSQWLDNAWTAGDFAKAIVIRSPASGCDPSQMHLVFAVDGAALTELEYLKLNLFVRLWRRLGWGIDELDAAMLQVVDPASLGSVANTGQALRNALVSLAHVSDLCERLKLGKQARLRAIAFWGDIPNFGPASLYAQLFLGKSAGSSTKPFDQVTGPLLPEGGELLSQHLTEVQAATGLTAAEMASVIVASKRQRSAGVPLTIDNAPLSMSVVSLLYRYAALATGMHVSVATLIGLLEVCGIDPFVTAPAGTAAFGVDSATGAATVRFVNRFEILRDAGLSVADVRYLLLDEDGGADRAPRDQAAVMGAMSRLQETLDQVRALYQVPADTTRVPSDELRQRLAARYPEATAAAVVGALDGTLQFTSTTTAAQALIAPAQLAAFPEVRANYDAIRDLQHLSCSGVLAPSRRGAIKTAYPTLAPLIDDLQAQAQGLFDGSVSDDLAAGAPPVTFTQLFADDTTPASRFALVIPQLYPLCRLSAEEHAVPLGLASLTGVAAERMEALCTDASVLADPATLGGGTPTDLVTLFRSAADRGFEARYYSDVACADPNPVILRVPECEALAYRAVATHSAADRARADAARSIRFHSLFRVATSGAYRFEATAGAAGERLTLALDGRSDGGFNQVTTATGELVRGLAVDLVAGEVYALTAEVRQRTAASTASFGVRSDVATAVRRVSDLEYRTKADVSAAVRGLALLDKLLLVAKRLLLSDAELLQLLQHKADFGPFSLNDLPNAAPGTLAPLFDYLCTLADYAVLRSRQALPDDGWSAILGAGRQHVAIAAGGAPSDADATLEAFDAYAEDVAERIGSSVDMVRSAVRSLKWDQAVVVAAPTGKRVTFGALVTVPGVRRLMDVLELSNRFGLKAEDIQQWATPFTSSEGAAAVREAIKARYADAHWRSVVKPLADDLRRQRRNALVAYIMDRKGFTLPEDLYEFFLVDPEMEPVVKTSRVRLAIASVQLFAHRCLMNLEGDVDPSAIVARYWPRMSRYRVWEASRKFLLFPNWLEPEFRDDQSHLFKALMGALLQGNVDRDSVEDAFFQYLQGLDQIARLQMVAMYSEEPNDRTLHVVGRTFSTPHKYFYRRNVQGSWMPWEPVGVDIDGDHLALAVWRHRLCVFWLTVTTKKRSATGGPVTFKAFNDTSPHNSEIQPTTDLEIRLNWSEYVNGAWVPRSAGNEQALVRFSDVGDFSSRSLFMHVRKRFENGSESGVEIHIKHASGKSADNLEDAFFVRSRHAPPELIEAEWGLPSAFYGDSAYEANRRWYYLNGLYANLSSLMGADYDSSISDRVLNATRDAHQYWLLYPSYGVIADTTSHPEFGYPFFYEDHDNTFYCEASVETHRVSKWNDWGLGYWKLRPYVKERPPYPTSPWLRNVIDPVVNPAVSESLYAVQPKVDWATQPASVIPFGGRFVSSGSSLSAAQVAQRLGLGRQSATGVAVDARIGQALGSVRLEVARNALARFGR